MSGPRLTEAQRTRAYGPPCRPDLLVPVELWGNAVRVHYAIHDQLVNACQHAHALLAAAGKPDAYPARIDSYSCRRIRRMLARVGLQRQNASLRAKGWSLHARGLAFDLFMTPEGVAPPGGVWTPTWRLEPILVVALEEAGFTWGGRWQRRDEPHFEWAGSPPARG